MAIKFNCPHCQKPFVVKDHLAGKRSPCPACTAATVSRGALLEAGAIKQVKEKLSWQQWTKRSLLAVSGLAAVTFVVWFTLNSMERNRASRAYTSAIEFVTTQANLPPEFAG